MYIKLENLVSVCILYIRNNNIIIKYCKILTYVVLEKNI